MPILNDIMDHEVDGFRRPFNVFRQLGDSDQTGKHWTCWVDVEEMKTLHGLTMN